MEEHLNKMKEAENENKKAGYQERIREIDNFLKKKELLDKFT